MGAWFEDFRGQDASRLGQRDIRLVIFLSSFAVRLRRSSFDLTDKDYVMRWIFAIIKPLKRAAEEFSRLELVRARRGVAAVEFALAATPLLMMIFGFISANLLFITWSNMQNAAYNAVYVMATGQVTSFQSKAVTCSMSLTNSQAEYYACQNLPTWVTFNATATENCTSPATVTVKVSASASATAGADIFSFFSGNSLVANATMMKQGTCP
jgi:Flp pilus assembly protein TadG